MSAFLQVDINCDLGEGLASDEEIMPYISSASIACGAHAGDEDTMRQTLRLCKKYNVSIGAHPGYEDKKNFGRLEQTLSNRSISLLVTQQLIQLGQLAAEEGLKLNHVKPHGALYNSSAINADVAESIAYAVYEFNSRLILYGLAGSLSLSMAESIGLRSAAEVFADRKYGSNGLLIPRSQKNAVLESEQAVVKQVLEVVENGSVTSDTKETISLIFQPHQSLTLCLHGDNPNAPQLAKAIYEALSSKNITIQAP